MTEIRKKEVFTNPLPTAMFPIFLPLIHDFPFLMWGGQSTKRTVLKIDLDHSAAFVWRLLVARIDHYTFGGASLANDHAEHQERTSVSS